MSEPIPLRDGHSRRRPRRKGGGGGEAEKETGAKKGQPVPLLPPSFTIDEDEGEGKKKRAGRRNSDEDKLGRDEG